jgi:hypothetical protein
MVLYFVIVYVVVAVLKIEAWIERELVGSLEAFLVDPFVSF